MQQKSIVAAFDFDGTLTYRDSLLPFLCFTTGTVEAYGKIILELPNLAGFWAGLNSRQATKESVLKRFFANKSLKDLQDMGKAFAAEKIPQLIRPASLSRLQWHLEQGHRCIIISANLDLYLNPWAQQMGIQDVICSECAINEQGQLTGKLQGKNCWGPEKTRRLTTLLGPRENYILYAYGDSKGDKELLEMADYSFYRGLACNKCSNF